jgi:hypothetical protein
VSKADSATRRSVTADLLNAVALLGAGAALGIVDHLRRGLVNPFLTKRRVFVAICFGSSLTRQAPRFLYQESEYDESNIDPVDRRAGSDHRGLFKH